MTKNFLGDINNAFDSCQGNLNLSWECLPFYIVPDCQNNQQLIITGPFSTSSFFLSIPFQSINSSIQDVLLCICIYISYNLFFKYGDFLLTVSPISSCHHVRQINPNLETRKLRHLMFLLRENDSIIKLTGSLCSEHVLVHSDCYNKIPQTG